MHRLCHISPWQRFVVLRFCLLYDLGKGFEMAREDCFCSDFSSLWLSRVFTYFKCLMAITCSPRRSVVFNIVFSFQVCAVDVARSRVFVMPLGLG